MGLGIPSLLIIATGNFENALLRDTNGEDEI